VQSQQFSDPNRLMCMDDVRLAVPADADGIAQVHVASWQSAYAGLVPATVIASRTIEKRRERWSQLLSEPEDPYVRTWVLTDNDVVVGFAHTAPCRDDDRTGLQHWELVAIYLQEDQWGRGRGRLLCETALRDAPRAGTDISLWALDTNERAIRFYESMGFERDAAPPEDTIDGHAQKVRFVRALPYEEQP
jgi:GNAT superfamily N-acetyltransferase